MKQIFFFALLSTLLSCNAKHGTPSGKCETLGTVRNYQGLDGCGYLIALANGDLLNPVKIPDNFQLRDKQVIRFNYKILEDVVTICMAEKASVEITCIEEANGSAIGTVSCVDTDNPFAVNWMDKAIDKHNPNQVIKYKFDSRWAYFFHAIPASFLYDCQGMLLCDTQGNPEDECHKKYLGKFHHGKTIWQGEGVWD